MSPEVKHPYEAVVVRYVPDVLTGESLNVGVVLVCPALEYADAAFLSRWTRVTNAFPNVEAPLLRRVASAVQNACVGCFQERSGQRPLAPRSEVVALVESVVPRDDASIQLSVPIRGATANPARLLHHLYRRYTTDDQRDDHRETSERQTRQDIEIWQSFARRWRRADLLTQLVPHTVKTPHYDLHFERAWKNGVWNAAQALSFDLGDPGRIRDKATSWTGRVLTARPRNHNTLVHFLVGMPAPDAPAPVHEAATDAFAILKENLGDTDQARVLTEDDSDTLAEKIATDLKHIG